MREKYILTGVVVRGSQIGHKIGFPTVNLIPDKNKKLPVSNGVYAARVKVYGKMYDAMANIGIRPTLDQHNLTVEAHIFNFSDDIYDTTISIFFYDFIRAEQKFSGLDELKSQLEKDKMIIQNILSGRMQPDSDT